MTKLSTTISEELCSKLIRAASKKLGPNARISDCVRIAIVQYVNRDDAQELRSQKAKERTNDKYRMATK